MRIIFITASLAALSGCVRHFRVEGMVVAVKPDPPTITVSHRAIPNLMPAMTMPFPLEHQRQLDGIVPGARISFDLRLRGQRSHIGKINILRSADDEVPVSVEKLPVGSAVPDFTLLNQHGEKVLLSDWKGRVVFIQFLYTRCPLPEVCPRLAASFASLRRRFSSPDLVLVSITLDPRYDSPEVLARYARSAGARPGWHFLTGPEPEIEKIARAFGLVHWAEEGVIVHSSYTAVVGRDQRLRALIEGSSYRLEQLATLAQHILKEP